MHQLWVSLNNRNRFDTEVLIVHTETSEIPITSVVQGGVFTQDAACNKLKAEKQFVLALLPSVHQNTLLLYVSTHCGCQLHAGDTATALVEYANKMQLGNTWMEQPSNPGTKWFGAAESRCYHTTSQSCSVLLMHSPELLQFPQKSQTFPSGSSADCQ